MDKCPHCQGELDWPKPRCLWCDREAVAYCDAIFGATMQDHEGRRVWNLDDPFFTCDAPMCAEHRKVVGFLCDKKEPDTFDHCPAHANYEPHAVDMTEDDAKRLRREVEASARRGRFASV